MEEYILRMLIKWGLLLNLVLVVPFILGLIPVKYMSKDKKTPACIYTCGWFLSFFVFEIVSLPFILLKKSFTLLVCVYSAITIFLLIFVHFIPEIASFKTKRPTLPSQYYILPMLFAAPSWPYPDPLYLIYRPYAPVFFLD